MLLLRTQPALGLFQSPNANGIGKAVDDQQYTITPVCSVNNAGATTVSTVAAEIPVYLSYTPKKPMTLNYHQAVLASPDPDKWFTILGLVDAATLPPPQRSYAFLLHRRLSLTKDPN